MNFGYNFILVCAPGYNFTLLCTRGKCGKFKQSQRFILARNLFGELQMSRLKDIQQGIREAISEIYRNEVCNVRGRR